MENIKNRVSAQQPFGNLRITQQYEGVKRLANKVVPGEKRCLYHANGMDIYNHELYVTCAEPNGKGEYSVVKLLWAVHLKNGSIIGIPGKTGQTQSAITKAISLFFLPKPVQRVKKIKKIYKTVYCTLLSRKSCG